MLVKSTRSNERKKISDAIISGIAKDGGLYVIEDFPIIDLNEIYDMNYIDMSIHIMKNILDEFTLDEIKDIIYRAYYDKFDTKNIVEMKHFDDCSFLELFHGPTLAFKDMALTILPSLLVKSMQKNNIKRDAIIITATSGDTGGSTLNGFKDIDNIKAIVIYPNKGVSEIQEKQMLSFQSNNLKVISLEGNFDDAQTFVKECFKKYPHLSSSNSINIGRLIPQIVYYFYGYIQMVKNSQIKINELINVSVPTGNFGDILALYIARKMSLPVKKLICASNQNKVLTDFFQTGIYDKNREFYKTNSPSMDILISSNLERLLYYISDSNTVNELMNNLKNTGRYQINKDMKEKLSCFYGGYCDINNTNKTISLLYDKYHYVIDPHTAVAYNVYKQYEKELQDKTKTMIVSTASFFKFSDTIAKIFNITGENDFIKIKKLSVLFNQNVPKQLNNFKNNPKIIWNKEDKDKKMEELLQVLEYV